jgi:integrase
MAALVARDGIAARALGFAILTAARTSEVIGATRDEISGDIWTVPAARIKGGKEHRVPLSDPALAILNALPTERGNPRVFIGNDPAAVTSCADAILRLVKSLRD